ncbi:PREDICTED: S-formylglutathione hydrolase-like isoform X1 [Rhagoletis zephyria]|uniref:S-formylglutathione hydrolase-like isoform X1 n=2 Tax=Rhagoletis zephyria TaxID=28612 RepID=UPI0008114324|nr:PREDICTED: S-formylglutathione hydrolase-like isoform X1 [Rhagoletis zephyria]
MNLIRFLKVQVSKMSLKLLSSVKCFGGEQRVYSHASEVLGCEMKFGVYMPPTAVEDHDECPVLYFLSGLTCTQDNFIQKSGFQQHASKHGIVVVNPDTSPRGLNLPGEDDHWDFGSGAGFYVDATEAPWSKNYKMYTYVTQELVELVNTNLPVLPNKRGIFGHSMGGHGALICALKNPGIYQSVSAFAPISNPVQCPWGKKAFSGYLGANEELWKAWDATELATVYAGTPLEILVDQGSEDNFYKEKQLLPENLLNAGAENRHLQLVYKQREGYDHSYFFIATFIGEHFDHHARFLKA